MQFLFDAQQFLLLVFLDGSDRNTGPARNDFFDVLARNNSRRRIVQLVAIAQQAQIFLLFAFFFRIKPGFFKFVCRYGAFHAVRDEFHTLLHFAYFFGHGCLAQFHTRTRFVNQIDCLVRKEAVGNIAVRKVNGIAQRFVGVRHRVELLVALANPVDHLNGFFFIRGRNFHGLEAAFERAIFFYGLSVFGGGCCPNALNFAARKRRFQNIRRVERAFRGARADKCVQLVNEYDRVLAFHQFFHDGLQSFFKLSAILCSCDDQRKVERKNSFVCKKRRNIAVGDALRESFHNGSFAYARFADEYGIVLRAAAQNLNDALDFSFASNQRIERTFRGSARQVAAEFRKQRSFFRT